MTKLTIYECDYCYARDDYGLDYTFDGNDFCDEECLLRYKIEHQYELDENERANALFWGLIPNDVQTRNEQKYYTEGIA